MDASPGHEHVELFAGFLANAVMACLELINEGSESGVLTPPQPQ
ncbi:MAG: hypothetical protein ACRDTH_06150 [Pseudonocardiaceae bacterium]